MHVTRTKGSPRGHSREIVIEKEKDTITNIDDDHDDHDKGECIRTCWAMSPLFQHAHRCGGSTFYLSGKFIPMLPCELSGGIMSLNPNVRRRALVFDIYLDSTSGRVLKTFYRWGIIKADGREVTERLRNTTRHTMRPSTVAV